jgi:hypothetical protein
VEDNILQETHTRSISADNFSDDSDELEYMARSERIRGYDMN